MISGIGVDLVELNRFDIYDEKFLNKILSDAEIDLFNARKSDRRKLEFIAGRFAAKEAFLKALGVGIGPIPFTDINVLANENGSPYIECNGEIYLVSITHTKTSACAFVVIEKSKK